MAAKDWAGVTAGLVLGAFGLGAWVASGGGESATGATTVAPPATEAVAPAAETVTVVETVPVPEIRIPGLSEEAARVLAANGYAGSATADAAALPDAVARTLERAGVVLLVPEGGTP
ncbi:MAG: hypothetical protein KQH83_12030 [Actinobacteria bacterium]|nr:hypothetical protein [Actinomycetota bacterium]